MARARQIGLSSPRLNRKRQWGYWFISIDNRTLVHDRDESGRYQIALDDLHTPEDSLRLVETVIALKSAWVDQRQVDDLRRALRETKKHSLPAIDVPRF